MSSPTTPTPVVAAFDVDGTLTTRDCVTPFLREVAGAHLAYALARHPLTVMRSVVTIDNDALKALACSALAGLDASAVDARGAAFARDVRAAWIRPDTLARLDRHRALGHAVVLVSASLEPYLRPLGARLGVDGVLCTRLETGPDGTLTGRLAGANCRGPEKERLLRAWLAERDLSGAEVWAYGDSRGDRELLAFADHAVNVRGRTLAPDADTLDSTPTGRDSP